MNEFTKAVVSISVITYVMSLFMRVTCCFWDQQPVYGYHALVMGWSALPSIGGFSWVANLLIFAAWIAFWVKKRASPSFVLSLMALALASMGVGSAHYQGNLSIGAYVWLASILVSFLAYAVNIIWEVKLANEI